jgi:MFS family permease
MKLLTYVREGAWPTVAGYGLFVALLTGGYYYNITFVQLGLLDLGTRHVGLARAGVSTWMAVLAVVTFLVAVVVGVTMDRQGWSRDLPVKLRLLFGVVVVQLLLTAVAPFIRTVPAFGGWILAASLSMGVGFPVTFAMTIDFVPVRDRGYVAAGATALTYFLANALPLEWRIETFTVVVLAAMLPAVVVLGVLVVREFAFLDELATQHETFGRGRFCRPAPVGTWSLTFWTAVVLMFGVFFVDSLGFLRIIETPALLLSSWQSPTSGIRLAIGGVHVLGASIAGVLYTNLNRRWLFLLVFGFFAFTHLLYTFELRVAGLFPALADGPSPLNPLMYAAAVSFYTTLNFALWPDLSTPETVGTHSALGVGFAGFFATFLSTAVALYLDSADVGLLSHLNLVNALALLLFVGLVVLLYVGRLLTLARARTDSRGGESSRG